MGTNFYVDLHVQGEPDMSLHDAHILSGKVKSSIRAAVSSVVGVLVHMEPFEPNARSMAAAASAHDRSLGA